jgi:hypothetical protein
MHNPKRIPTVAGLGGIGRKENIKQDEARLLPGHDVEGFGTVNGGKHLVASGFEGQRQDSQDYRIVINNQYFVVGKTCCHNNGLQYRKYTGKREDKFFGNVPAPPGSASLSRRLVSAKQCEDGSFRAKADVPAGSPQATDSFTRRQDGGAPKIFRRCFAALHHHGFALNFSLQWRMNRSKSLCWTS